MFRLVYFQSGQYSVRFMFGQVNVPTGLCSNMFMFRRYIFWQVHAQTGLCLDRSMLIHIYAKTGLCSDMSMFRQVYVQTGLFSGSSIFRQVEIRQIYVQSGHVQTWIFSHNSMFRQVYDQTCPCLESLCQDRSMFGQDHVYTDVCIYKFIFKKL